MTIIGKHLLSNERHVLAVSAEQNGLRLRLARMPAIHWGLNRALLILLINANYTLLAQEQHESDD